ncbi:MAG: hypothetical protein HY717_07030 [Planctomycetes bacterium]|nr:hypothetical protein [Planctomycetota bacterium]
MFAAALKLLRGETVLAGIERSPAERLSLLPAEYEKVLNESRRPALEAALSELERAMDLLPERFEAHFLRGWALLLLGRGPGAVRALEEAIARGPGFAPALVLKTEALGSGEELALAGDPRGEAWSRARRALREWRFEEAAAAYGELNALEETAGELYPGSGIAHLLACGVARLRAGDHADAIARLLGGPGPRPGVLGGAPGA